MNSFVVRAIKNEMATVILPLSQSITFNNAIQQDLEHALMKCSYMTGYSRESDSNGNASLVLKFKSKDCISDEIIQDFRSILKKHGINTL